ncbi:hypothetical protein [Chitinivibrio alkaliphilus]|uniref:Phosphate ABC transporter substrate-binding protein n=1 Tax=Chitinivibrio alkaliphilus ACht1 TaxID=1313304 RepID=U7DAZ2_9BACT|nr:hypothetical protein [Chitinivibrio alkaliphilus]ERP39197.1 hypothetical protein CALK_0367 [Chitinivibrio alkaliphilus ACht1]
MKHIIILLMLSVSLFATEFVVVVHPGNTKESISPAMLRRYYTGRANEIDGKRAVPINFTLDSELAEAFLSQVVRRSPAQYRQDWSDRQIRGEGSAPMVHGSFDAIIGMVNTVPGAIGYLPADQVDERVKVIELK